MTEKQKQEFESAWKAIKEIRETIHDSANRILAVCPDPPPNEWLVQLGALHDRLSHIADLVHKEEERQYLKQHEQADHFTAPED